MQGDALLVVQADNGEQGYTRRGDLQLSQSGLHLHPSHTLTRKGLYLLQKRLVLRLYIQVMVFCLKMQILQRCVKSMELLL